MNDTDLESMVRAALRAEARALVPDDTHRPEVPTAGGPSVSERPLPRRHRVSRPRVWLACGLAGAVAAAVVVAVSVVTGEARSERQAPLEPVASTAVTASVTATPPPAVATSTAPSPGTSDDLGRDGTQVGVPAEDGASSAPTSASPDAEVYVYAHCNGPPSDDPPVRRPTDIGLACADNGENLGDLRWTTWSANAATGSGTVEWRTCSQDCASGSTIHTELTVVTLTDPVVGQDGVPVFTHLVMDPDPVPHGGYDLGTVR